MDNCIEWGGEHWANGYPYRLPRPGDPPGKHQIAMHREVWEQANGPIPPGMHVMHLCDNRGCINIEHLQIGTPKDNAQDMVNKRRQVHTRKTTCPNGHEYDKVVRRLTGPRAGSVGRYCSICANARRRERRRFYG